MIGKSERKPPEAYLVEVLLFKVFNVHLKNDNQNHIKSKIISFW
jgi:hypothetical protein